MTNSTDYSFPMELKHILLGMLPTLEMNWSNDGCSDDEYPTYRSFVTSHPDEFEKLSSSAIRIAYEKQDLLRDGKITNDEYVAWCYYCLIHPQMEEWDIEKRGYLDCEVVELKDNHRTVSVEPIYF